MYRVEPGTTKEAVLAGISDGSFDLTSAAADGLGALSPGGTARLDAPTEPGEYVLICFLPSALHGGAPHFTQGMIDTITVG